jgi:hypothetical protein
MYSVMLLGGAFLDVMVLFSLMRRRAVIMQSCDCAACGEYDVQRQEGNDFADSDGSRTRRHILRHRRSIRSFHK